MHFACAYQAPTCLLSMSWVVEGTEDLEMGQTDLQIPEPSPSQTFKKQASVTGAQGGAGRGIPLLSLERVSCSSLSLSTGHRWA